MAEENREINQEMAEDNNDEDLFGCGYCERSFTSAQALGGHQNGHRRERDAVRRGQYGAQMRNQPRLANQLPAPALAPVNINGTQARANAAPAVGATYNVYHGGHPSQQPPHLPSHPQQPPHLLSHPLVRPSAHLDRVVPLHSNGGTAPHRLQDQYVYGYAFNFHPWNVYLNGHWRRINRQRNPNPRAMALPYPRPNMPQPTVTFAGPSSGSRQNQPQMSFSTYLQLNQENNNNTITPTGLQSTEVLVLRAAATPSSELTLAPPIPRVMVDINRMCTCGQEEIDLELRL